MGVICERVEVNNKRKLIDFLYRYPSYSVLEPKIKNFDMQTLDSNIEAKLIEHHSKYSIYIRVV